MITKKTICKIYILSGLLLPILFLYSLPIKGFTVGDLFLVLSIALMFATGNVKKISYPFLILITSLVFNTLSVFLIKSFSMSTLLTSLRYFVYLFYIVLLPNCENFKSFATTSYLNIVKICMFYLFLQTMVLKVTGFCLPGVLTFARLTDSSLADYQSAVMIQNSGRCMSLFGEPSHYSIYVLPSLALCLFYSNTSHKYLMSLLISASIILSLSFTGVLVMALIWLVFLLKTMHRSGFSIQILLFVFFSFIVAIVLFSTTKAGSYLINASNFKSQSGGRFEGFKYVFTLKQSFFGLLFGNGMDDIGEKIYLASWPRIIYYFGYFGFVIYLLIFLYFAKIWKLGGIIMLITIILMIGTEFTFGPLFIPYVVFIIAYRNEEYVEQKRKSTIGIGSLCENQLSII